MALPDLVSAQRIELARALEHANVPALVGSLFQLTGDPRWLEPPYRPTRARGPGDHDSGGLEPAARSALLAAAADVLEEVASGERKPAPDPAPSDLVRGLRATLGEPVPMEMAPMLAEEVGVHSRDVDLGLDGASDAPSVIIVGAGISGLCAGIQLGRAGVPYTIVEKNPGTGGTWVENVYPGCGVDTPVHLYSFSFAQRPDWSRYFARQSEVEGYLRDLAGEHGVDERTLFETEVLEAAYDEPEALWRVRVRRKDGREETLSANVLISAVGLLNVPSVPALPGFERFAGPAMHTARWRRDVQIEGKRVGVIGTGASAMQLVPAIAGVASEVVVFQRSPQWAFPNPNYKRAVSPEVQWLMRNVPGYQAWYRLRQLWAFGDKQHPALQIDPEWPHPDRAINAVNDRHREYLTKHIEAELAGHPDLLRQCLPGYPVYGKRPLIDNGWYETMCRDDVNLITEEVAGLREASVVTGGGGDYPVDVLALGTGFQTLRMVGSYEVRGRSGRTLRDAWGEDDARAYMGMTVPGFPNFYCLFGPNTNAGHGGSHLLSVEMQVRYVLQMIGAMAERGARSYEVRDDVFAAFNTRLDEALEGTIWTHPGMTTYYRNSRGRIVSNIPWTNAEYWRMTRYPDLTEFSAG